LGLSRGTNLNRVTRGFWGKKKSSKKEERPSELRESRTDSAGGFKWVAKGGDS